MDNPDSQISIILLKLIEEISTFVKAYLQDGEKALLNCDSQPAFLAIKQILSQITIEDIGITSKTLGFFFQPQKICGIKVLEEVNASISVFCLSKEMSLSFHDHPHMAVLSKVLYGELERVSVEMMDEEPDKKKIAKKKAPHHIKPKPESNTKRFVRKFSRKKHENSKRKVIGNIIHKDVIKANGILRLNPLIENIHYLKAKTDCILFDILIPNYDNSFRMCHFYKEIGSQYHPNLMVSKKIKLEDEETNTEQKDVIEGKIVLEEIEEPPEIQSFVVVAFPKLLTLKI